MARSVEEVIKMQLGNLLTEVAVLTAQMEKLNEELKAANEKLGKKEGK